ncbi:MAG: ArnT family glycosyltransferase [Cyclobacteriaceae bacterium]
MILRNNYIVPTEFGDIYTKKPPLYNWVIIFFYKLLGNYSEWAVRLGSVLSLLGTAGLVCFLGKRFVDHRFGIISAFFYIIVADLLFVFSFLGEIDLFYSFLTVLSISSIFYFHQRQQYVLLFCFTYFFGALGTLTKGLPSIPFLGASLLSFSIYTKEFKRLLSIPHIVGILIYLLIVGGYLYAYHLQEDLVYYLSGMFGDASQRTSGDFPFWEYVQHIFLFPLQTIAGLLPTSLLLIFFSKKALKTNAFIYFCFLIFSFNIILYWISPGSKQRYIYPLYPFICIVLSYLFYTTEYKKRTKNLNIFYSYLLILLGLICFSLPFLTHLDASGLMTAIPLLEVVSITFGVLFIVLGYLRFKLPAMNTPLFIAGIILVRLIMDLTLIHARNHPSNKHVAERIKTVELVNITKGANVFSYGTTIKHRIAFYYSKESNKIIYGKDKVEDTNTKDFYIVESKNPALINKPNNIFLEFMSGSTSMKLIKFLE